MGIKPTPKEQLIAARDALLREVVALQNEVKGLQRAIDVLQDEEDKAK
jgi:hypothetical protein